MEAKDTGPPNPQFEFDALKEAKNYRQALLREFSPHLHGDILEVGAGIGQNTVLLRTVPGIRRLLCLEPDGAFCRQFKADHPSTWLVEGTIAALHPSRSSWDGIVSINVLEHIADDLGELRNYAGLLRARKGALCLFVPARPEIYSALDRDFGHYRRYARPELLGKLHEAGFSSMAAHYFNAPGYFAWWLNFCLLGKRKFEVKAVRFFDRVILPVTHYLESRLVRPPFGQSLLAIARP